MGIFSSSKESQIIQLIRLDKPIKLKEFLLNNNINPNEVYTKRKRALIQLCCYYSSPKCLTKLISLNYDYNKKELSNNYTPLYIACKFNCIKIVKILLSKEDIKILQKTNDNFNEFEIAFLKGNYNICYYLLYEYKSKINNKKDVLNLNDNNKDIDINVKVNDDNNNNINDDINTNYDIDKNKKEKEKKENEENEENNENNENIEFQIDPDQPYQTFFFSDEFKIEEYTSLQDAQQCPLFNMKLFYASLINRIPPEECKSFEAERKRTKDLLNKVPDPNETWGHFFKRLANMELYNPPLVDRRNVTQMNSLYMNAQMRLIENEYGVKMGFCKSNDETQNIYDDEERDDMPIIRIQNTVKRPLKDESQITNNLKESENSFINHQSDDNDVNNENIYDVEIKKKGVKERNMEDVKIDNKSSVCVLNIQNNSSEREMRENIEKREEEEK